MLESDYDKTIKYTDTDSLHGVHNIPYNSLSSQITVLSHSDSVVDRMKFITAYLGIAIAISFLALFQYSNGENQSAWRWLFVVLSFMTGATFYYYNEWKSMREFSDLIDNTTLAWEHANRNFKSR